MQPQIYKKNSGSKLKKLFKKTSSQPMTVPHQSLPLSTYNNQILNTQSFSNQSTSKKQKKSKKKHSLLKLLTHTHHHKQLKNNNNTQSNHQNSQNPSSLIYPSAVQVSKPHDPDISLAVSDIINTVLTMPRPKNSNFELDEEKFKKKKKSGYYNEAFLRIDSSDSIFSDITEEEDDNFIESSDEEDFDYDKNFDLVYPNANLNLYLDSNSCSLNSEFYNNNLKCDEFINYDPTTKSGRANRYERRQSNSNSSSRRGSSEDRLQVLGEKWGARRASLAKLDELLKEVENYEENLLNVEEGSIHSNYEEILEEYIFEHILQSEDEISDIDTANESNNLHKELLHYQMVSDTSNMEKTIPETNNPSLTITEVTDNFVNENTVSNNLIYEEVSGVAPSIKITEVTDDLSNDDTHTSDITSTEVSPVTTPLTSKSDDLFHSMDEGSVTVRNSSDHEGESLNYDEFANKAIPDEKLNRNPVKRSFSRVRRICRYQNGSEPQNITKVEVFCEDPNSSREWKLFEAPERKDSVQNNVNNDNDALTETSYSTTASTTMAATISELKETVSSLTSEQIPSECEITDYIVTEPEDVVEDVTEKPQLDLKKIEQRKAIFNGVGMLVHLATSTAALSFEVAKSSTKFGIRTAKTVVDGVGTATGITLPTSLISSTLSVAEWIAITSIETGRFWTDFGLESGKLTLEVLGIIFGSSDIAISIKEFTSLVQKQEIFTDKDGLELSYSQVLRGLTAWAYLQSTTEIEYTKSKWIPSMTLIASTPLNNSLQLVSEPVGVNKFIPIDRENEEVVNLLENVKHFIHFACGAYGSNATSLLWSRLPFSSNSMWLSPRNHYHFARHTGISLADIRHTSHSQYNDLHNYHPQFYVVLDRKFNQVVLALRGSLSLHDFLIDLTCESEEVILLKDNKKTTVDVHSGMYRAAKKICDAKNSNPIFTAVKSLLEENPTFGLTIAGHSLGAGIGTLISLIWGDLDTALTKPESGLPPNRTITCYAYGSPCVISLNGVKLCESIVKSITVESDIVCRFSLGSSQDLRNCSKWLINNREVMDKLIKRMLSTKKNSQEDFALRLEIEKECLNSKKLYSAGEVYYLNKFNLYRVNDLETVFNSLILNRGYNHHLPSYYDKIIGG
ncbi:hypothetical protein HK099_008642, partial [Clydaea vesicula]